MLKNNKELLKNKAIATTKKVNKVNSSDLQSALSSFFNLLNKNSSNLKIIAFLNSSAALSIRGLPFFTKLLPFIPFIVTIARLIFSLNNSFIFHLIFNIIKILLKFTKIVSIVTVLCSTGIYLTYDLLSQFIDLSNLIKFKDILLTKLIDFLNTLISNQPDKRPSIFSIYSNNLSKDSDYTNTFYPKDILPYQIPQEDYPTSNYSWWTYIIIGAITVIVVGGVYYYFYSSAGSGGGSSGDSSLYSDLKSKFNERWYGASDVKGKARELLDSDLPISISDVREKSIETSLSEARDSVINLKNTLEKSLENMNSDNIGTSSSSNPTPSPTSSGSVTPKAIENSNTFNPPSPTTTLLMFRKDIFSILENYIKDNKVNHHAFNHIMKDFANGMDDDFMKKDIEEALDYFNSRLPNQDIPIDMLEQFIEVLFINIINIMLDFFIKYSIRIKNEYVAFTNITF